MCKCQTDSVFFIIYQVVGFTCHQWQPIKWTNISARIMNIVLCFSVYLFEFVGCRSMTLLIICLECNTRTISRHKYCKMLSRTEVNSLSQQCNFCNLYFCLWNLIRNSDFLYDCVHNIMLADNKVMLCIYNYCFHSDNNSCFEIKFTRSICSGIHCSWKYLTLAVSGKHPGSDAL